MSPEQRAEKVCAGTGSYRERKRALTEVDNQIRERENLLATGYRAYEQCQLVSVSVAAAGAIVDCSGLSGGEAKKCKNGNTAQTTETRRVCVETRVPVDYNYESALLRDLRMGRESQIAFHQQLTEDCRYRAISLTAEEAFSLYQSNGEP